MFTAHLWTGIIVGAYLLVVSLTGAALVFRIDMQRAVHPALLQPQSDMPARPMAEVIGALEAHFPDARIAGVDAPTINRPVHLAYVSDEAGFHSVLVDPGTARVLGELRDESFIRTVQQLHFNLLMGETGHIVNGVGALCVLLLCFTGAWIWWQGGRRWTRGLRVRTGSGAAVFIWDLHRATGFWVFLMLVMWAITALNFVFPRQFRAAVDAVSTLSAPAIVQSDVARAGSSAPGWESLIARAEAERPGEFVARVVLPAKPADAIQVFMSARQPTPTGPDVLRPVHLDRYTGEVIRIAAGESTIGDVIMRWAAPLHVGHFAGTGTRILWCLLGLSPAILFITGFLTWWRRVVVPSGRRRHAQQTRRQGDVAQSR
jgi:uncharacterized iron-regulated membrane protein